MTGMYEDRICYKRRDWAGLLAVVPRSIGGMTTNRHFLSPFRRSEIRSRLPHLPGPFRVR